MFTPTIHVVLFALTSGLTAAKCKRRKVEKKTHAERATEGMMKVFMEYQARADEAFQQFLGEQLRQMNEQEERRRHEEREHELRLAQLIMQSGVTSGQYAPTHPNPYHE